MINFLSVAAGDIVTRLLAGVSRMQMTVESVDDHLIHCAGGWMFERTTGAEYDPYLEWGTRFGQTGSVLVHD